MPLYDYIYGTLDKSSNALYETSLNKEEEVPHVVHLTHLTTPESIYHLWLGIASFASSPHISKWYMWLMWPMTLLSKILTWIYGRTFVVERHRFNKLSLQLGSSPSIVYKKGKISPLFLLLFCLNLIASFFFFPNFGQHFIYLLDATVLFAMAQ